MSDNEEPMIQTPADFGHFLLEKELGHGGMGGVYLARDKMLDRKVGIKVMLKSLGADPKFVERFQREAQAAARLNHPNIAQIYSFGQEQGMPYIAMELVPGGSLDKEMEANPGKLDIVHVMRVGQQVADALAVAAESGLVHGDVKPENVLFDTDGNAKLVDFGLAAMQGDSDEIWGTPYYISPEKVRRQKIDYRADIYSLGGTLYHVLTGVPPFDGPDPTAVVKARFDGPPKKPSEIRPDIPPEVDSIIMRMLELEPSMRYPTYQSLLGDFKRYLSKAGPAKKSIKIGGAKLKFKGAKPKLKLSSTGGTTGLVDGEVGELPPDGTTMPVEEKKRMNLGVVVGMTVIGVILLILLVIGGLYWYVESTKAAEDEKAVTYLSDRQSAANKSLDNTVATIKSRYDEFHKNVQKLDQFVKGKIHEVEMELPDELKAEAAVIFSPPPSAAIIKAVAYTNKLFGAESPAPAAAAAAKPAATNQTATAAASTNSTNTVSAAQNKEIDKDAEAERAMAEAEAKVAGNADKKNEVPPEQGEKKDEPKEEPKAEEPAEEDKQPDFMKDLKPMQLPLAVKNLSKLWDILDQCRAADIMFYGRMTEIINMAEKAKEMTGNDAATVEALENLSKEVVSKVNALNDEKWMTDARRAAHGLERRALDMSKEAVRKIKQAASKREKQIEELREKAKKAAAAKAAAEKLKQEIADELQKAKDAFAQIAADAQKYKSPSYFARWTRNLARVQKGMKTPEGKEAVGNQLRKVECMEAMHKHLIKYAKGQKLKTRGAVVANADDKAITIQEVKVVYGKATLGKENRIEWDRFYGLKEKNCLFYLNDLINALVIGDGGKIESSPLKRSDNMLGAALILQYFYAEEKGVDKFIPVVVQKAVEEFGPCRKWAEMWFTNVKLEDAE